MSSQNEKSVEKSGANHLDWEEDFKNEEKPRSTTDGKKVKYMVFDKPGMYTVRLVGKGVKFLRHWEPFTKGGVKQRIITDKKYEGEDKAWAAGFWPRETFAIYLFDRNDNNELKVLEKGKQIFGGFSSFKTVEGINPANPDEAPEFVIEVVWPKGDRRQADYKVTARRAAAPLTAEEKQKYKETFIPLEEFYKSTPLNKINELFDALPEELKIYEKKKTAFKDDSKDTAKKAAPAPSTTSSRPAQKVKDNVETNGEDLFDDKKGSDDAPF